MSEGLNKRQLRAVTLILQGKTLTEGCQKAGISRVTFYKWMTIPAFKEEFQRQRKEIVADALHTLKLSSTKAAEVLIALLESSREDMRFKTACAIHEHVNKFIELEDIENRLTAIERRMGR